VPQGSDQSGKKRKRRAAPKRARLAAALREEILTGRLEPNQQMPTRAELESRFRVSRITVQHALDTLRHDGLVVTRGRAGTFVADRPPHRRRFAVIFPTHPASSHWSMRYDAIEIATRRIEKQDGIELVSYYDATGVGDEAAFDRLHADCRAGLIGGIIHAHPPYHWDRDGRPDSGHNVPEVSLSRTRIGDRPTVCEGQADFVEHACQLFAELGCRRIACLGLGATGLTVRDVASHACQQARRHGMTVPDGWVVPVHPQMPETAHAVARLLMDREPAQRPDGVLVTDDHLVEQVTQGLTAAGMEAAQNVKIVVHVNFPLVPASVLPVYRLGSDMVEQLRCAVSLIERLQRGQPVPEASYVPLRDERAIRDARALDASVTNDATPTSSAARPTDISPG